MFIEVARESYTYIYQKNVCRVNPGSRLVVHPIYSNLLLSVSNLYLSTRNSSMNTYIFSIVFFGSPSIFIFLKFLSITGSDSKLSLSCYCVALISIRINQQIFKYTDLSWIYKSHCQVHLSFLKLFLRLLSILIFFLSIKQIIKHFDLSIYYFINIYR